jgi:galactitol-specific phosphotransferase system IIB component
MELGKFIGSATEGFTDDDSDFLLPYWRAVFEQAGLPALKDELNYLYGLRHLGETEIDVMELSGDLVAGVSSRENFPYAQDGTLYPRLVAHLRRSLDSRRRWTSPNPLNSLIVQNHAHLCRSIEAVWKKHSSHTYSFPSSDAISSLALHFLVSQRNLGVGRKMRVIFVCSTGLGAAKIISRMISSEARRIEIISHCSPSEVRAAAEQLRPDFLISVFPLETELPVVVVQPIPSKADIQAVNRVVDSLTEPNELFNHDYAIDYRMDYNEQEDSANEVVLTGLRIYERLHNASECRVRPGMEFPFLAHIMLLASRYVFGRQSDKKPEDVTALGDAISEWLADAEIYLTPDETNGLTYYLEDTRGPGKEA